MAAPFFDTFHPQPSSFFTRNRISLPVVAFRKLLIFSKDCLAKRLMLLSLSDVTVQQTKGVFTHDGLSEAHHFVLFERQ